MRIDTSSNINTYYTKNSQVEIREKEASDISKIPAEIQEDINVSNVQSKEHEVIEAIEKANKHFKTFDRRLKFSIHEKTKQIMVKVINTEDNSIVREIPSEKILDMVAKLWEMSGIFVDEKR